MSGLDAELSADRGSIRRCTSSTASASTPGRAWRLRYPLTIALAHVVALLAVGFVFLLSDALLAGYAPLVRDSILVRNAAELSWLQRVSADMQAAAAYVSGLSAVVQFGLWAWRGRCRAAVTPHPPLRLMVQDFAFVLARALRAVGVGLVVVASASMLASAAHQSAGTRSYGLIAAASASVLLSHWLTPSPPSTGGS